MQPFQHLDILDSFPKHNRLPDQIWFSQMLADLRNKYHSFYRAETVPSSNWHHTKPEWWVGKPIASATSNVVDDINLTHLAYHVQCLLLVLPPHHSVPFLTLDAWYTSFLMQPQFATKASAVSPSTSTLHLAPFSSQPIVPGLPEEVYYGHFMLMLSPNHLLQNTPLVSWLPHKNPKSCACLTTSLA